MTQVGTKTSLIINLLQKKKTYPDRLQTRIRIENFFNPLLKRYSSVLCFLLPNQLRIETGTYYHVAGPACRHEEKYYKTQKYYHSHFYFLYKTTILQFNSSVFIAANVTRLTAWKSRGSTYTYLPTRNTLVSCVSRALVCGYAIINQCK